MKVTKRLQEAYNFGDMKRGDLFLASWTVEDLTGHFPREDLCVALSKPDDPRTNKLQGLSLDDWKWHEFDETKTVIKVSAEVIITAVHEWKEAEA